jgi:hypothetical protein
MRAMSTEVNSRWPQHVATLISNTNEVAGLLQIHAVFTGGRTGRPRVPLEVLNKSAVVLLVACWEAYVEDLATAAFDVMLDRAPSPRAFPPRVLALASKPLRESNDETSVWALAQQGWKEVLADHRKQLYDRFVGRLNTPRPGQVDALFESLIGMRALSKSWRWRGRSNPSVTEALNALVTLRGEIAHRVQTSRRVHKTYITRSLELINRIAAISSNQVLGFVGQRIHERPWVQVAYGKTG